MADSGDGAGSERSGERAGGRSDRERSDSEQPRRALLDRLHAGYGRDLLVGVAVVLPLALLAFLVRDLLAWIVGAARSLVGALHAVGVDEPALVAVALVATLVALPIALVAVGTVVRHRYGRRVVRAVDDVIESIPGLGPVYTGLRRSREVLAAPEGQAFAGVVRVELADGVHALAFRVDRSAHETASGDGVAVPERESPDDHVDALADDQLATVFLPFAPNPIVGGHLVTVRTDRIEPTDLTVPQALGVLVGLGSPDDAPDPDVPFESFYVDEVVSDVEASVGEETASADGD